jgi:hypothetical protein
MQHIWDSWGNTYKIVSENLKTVRETMACIGSQTLCEDVGWIHPAQDKEQWLNLVKTIMTYGYYKRQGTF